MVLAPGNRLGVYEITAPLGAGGMGEVYRARDTKLGRDVAIKVLPDGFTHDAERIARFQREAQILASLSHPHIAAIYGLEEANESQFLRPRQRFSYSKGTTLRAPVRFSAERMMSRPTVCAS